MLTSREGDIPGGHKTLCRESLVCHGIDGLCHPSRDLKVSHKAVAGALLMEV